MKFFFVKTLGGEPRGLALVSLYSPPRGDLLQLSHDTLVVCKYQAECLIVIPIQSVISVVAMVPLPVSAGDAYFMIEKIGLDVIDIDDTGDEE